MYNIQETVFIVSTQWQCCYVVLTSWTGGWGRCVIEAMGKWYPGPSNSPLPSLHCTPSSQWKNDTAIPTYSTFCMHWGPIYACSCATNISTVVCSYTITKHTLQDHLRSRTKWNTYNLECRNNHHTNCYHGNLVRGIQAWYNTIDKGTYLPMARYVIRSMCCIAIGWATESHCL